MLKMRGVATTLPMRIFRADVIGREPLGPGMVRITLGGPGLHGFASTGVGDEYLRLFLPDPQTGELRLPVASGESWEYPDGVQPGPLRTYTVRRFDAAAGHLVVDVVLHEGGIAATWARDVRPGSSIGVNTPCGLYAAPSDIRWRLLVADAPGVPAAMRLLEDGDPAVRTRAILEVPDARHELPAPEGCDVTWVHGGNGHGPSRIEEIVRSVQFPAEPGYVWVAGETRVTRAVRKYLRHELKLPAGAYKVVGYWNERGEEWNARYAALDEEVKRSLAAIWESSRDEEDIMDEYTERLELLGL